MEKITFTGVGKQYTEGKETELKESLLNIAWKSIAGQSIGFSQGMALKKIMSEIKGKHTHFQEWINTPFLNEGAVYGIKTEYKNASVNSFWFDNGCETTCIMIQATTKAI